MDRIEQVRTAMSLWDSVKVLSAKASAAALVAGHKTKLRTDLLLADRELNLRKYRFGIELYDHVAPMASQVSFWQDGDEDMLTSTIRPALLETQREIAALEIRRGKQKERINQAEVTRQAAFPKKAENFGEKVLNAGLAAGYAGNAAKLQAELAMIETQIKGHKEEFGVKMYAVFADLEDNRGWLPTDRHIRAMYDQTRRDLEQIELKRTSTEMELKGEVAPASNNVSVNTTPSVTTTGRYGASVGVSAATGTSIGANQSRFSPPAVPTTSYGANNGRFSPPAVPTSSYGANNGSFSAPVPNPSYGTNHGSFAPPAPTPSYGVNNGMFASPAQIPNYGASNSFAATAQVYGSSSSAGFTPSHNFGSTPGTQASYGAPMPTFASPTPAYGVPSTGYAAPRAVPSASQPYDPFSLLSSPVPVTRPVRPPAPPGSDLLDFNYND